MSVAVRVIPASTSRTGASSRRQLPGPAGCRDPVELARRYDAQGADEITFLDVSASSEGRATHDGRRLSHRRAGLRALTVGGGVRSADDVARLLRAARTRSGSTPPPSPAPSS
nr:HisA/HisF-related TIM barrel protein [Actinomyces denticolens]